MKYTRNMFLILVLLLLSIAIKGCNPPGANHEANFKAIQGLYD